MRKPGRALELDRLFITSSGEGLTGKYDGCIFSCKVDEKGCLPDLAKKLSYDG